MNPEKLVLDILQEEWSSTLTYDLTPNITFGWFDEDKEIPQVTIRQPDEEPINGGETGFSGIYPADGSPTQRITGTIGVHIWCRPDDLDSATTRNPRQYNQAVTNGIQEIIKDGYQDSPASPRTGETPVNYLSYGGKTPAPEPDDTIKMLRHYVVTLNYGYGPS